MFIVIILINYYVLHYYVIKYTLQTPSNPDYLIAHFIRKNGSKCIHACMHLEPFAIILTSRYKLDQEAGDQMFHCFIVHSVSSGINLRLYSTEKTIKQCTVSPSMQSCFLFADVTTLAIMGRKNRSSDHASITA